MTRRLTLLGSTGSIGKSALKVVRNFPEEFEVVGLAAHSNVDELAAQIEEFKPARVALGDANAAVRLRDRGSGIELGGGAESISGLAGVDVDV